MSVKAVFLDVGWTLVHPQQSMWELFAEICRESGTDLDPVQVERSIHGLMAASRDRAIADFSSGTEYSDSDEEFTTMFHTMSRVIFAGSGIEGDHGEMSEKFFQRFWNGENWVVFPDVIAGIQRIRESGSKVGVLSNASSDLLGFLEKLGLLEHFDFTVVSAIEGTKKPDRRIFQRALDRAGVSSDDAVHVGDMFLEDVLGARNVGVRPLLMDRGARGMFPNHPSSDSGADIEVVRNLEDVLEAIRRRN